MTTAKMAAPLAPPGWEGATDRLLRLVAPSGDAVAWVVGELGANCVGYAVRRPEGWVQLFDAGNPQDLAERPTRFGCPILFPFPGHVLGARYRWGGVARALPPTGPGPIAYVHGFAARLPWSLVRSGDDAVAGELLTTRDIPGGAVAAGYPFAVRLRLEVQLTDRALTIALSATNEGADSAPVGLGLHPYFAIAALAEERTAVRVALPGRFAHRLDGNIPTGERLPVAESAVRLPPLGELAHAPHTDLGPNPVATLLGSPGSLRVRLTCLEGVRDLLLFAPPTENSVSIEPLSTAPGAASQPEGHPDGLVGLEPGATQRLAVAFAAD